MSWKDRKHPRAGGAEIVTGEILTRLVSDGHDVTLLTARYDGASEYDEIDGYSVVRVGGRFSVYIHACRYFRRHLADVDLVIDEVNTVPFFARFYAQTKTVLFVHQLARQIWFHEMVFPVSVIGYVLEPLYLRFLRRSKVVTVSQSTRADLMRYGYRDYRISVISEGIQIPRATDVQRIQRYPDPTVLSLGSVRSMKRTDHVVRGFERLKDAMPGARLIIAGDTSGHYGERVLRAVTRSHYSADIIVRGRVSEDEKRELMQRSHVIAVTSVKEGWGLIVTEAASQGTAAVVYDVDGLRDSVRNGETGIVCRENSPEGLAVGLHEMLKVRINQEHLYKTYGRAAHAWSKEITFDQSYTDFCRALKLQKNPQKTKS